MIDFSESVLQRVAVHLVGNSKLNGELHCSKRQLQLSEHIRPLLQTYFQHPFRNVSLWYQFQGESNKVEKLCETIFSNKEKFLSHSVQLAKCLFEVSNHPAIKEGELFVAHLSGLQLDGQAAEAVGLFKSENKETYLKVLQKESEFELEQEEGIHLHKMDKGCLVLKIEGEEHYRVCMVDTGNVSSEARYWKNDFLDLSPRNDNYHKTQSLINLTRDFCNDVLVEDNQVSPVDRMIVMNDSMKFMKQHNAFSMEEFEQGVFQEPAVIEAFHDYKRNYEPLREAPVDFGSIEVEPSAVKHNSKFFRHVLKLDKNFHLYVHGDPNLLERGFDEQRNMKYYKLFYQNETHPS